MPLFLNHNICHSEKYLTSLKTLQWYTQHPYQMAKSQCNPRILTGFLYPKPEEIMFKLEIHIGRLHLTSNRPSSGRSVQWTAFWILVLPKMALRVPGRKCRAISYEIHIANRLSQSDRVTKKNTSSMKHLNYLFMKYMHTLVVLTFPRNRRNVWKLRKILRSLVRLFLRPNIKSTVIYIRGNNSDISFYQ